MPDIPTRNVKTLPVRRSLACGFWLLELKLPEVVCVWLLLINGFHMQRQIPELAFRDLFCLFRIFPILLAYGVI